MADFYRHVSVAVSVSITVSVAVSVTVSVKTVFVPAVMPLLLGRVRGNSAAGTGGRAPSFPRKRVGGAPGAYECEGNSIPLLTHFSPEPHPLSLMFTLSKPD